MNNCALYHDGCSHHVPNSPPPLFVFDCATAWYTCTGCQLRLDLSTIANAKWPVDCNGCGQTGTKHFAVSYKIEHIPRPHSHNVRTLRCNLALCDTCHGKITGKALNCSRASDDRPEPRVDPRKLPANEGWCSCTGKRHVLNGIHCKGGAL
jgi:hypothetical protein